MDDSNETFDSVAFAKVLAQGAADLQATDIQLIDLRGLVAYTDGFVVCSGRNRRHVLGIADEVRQRAKAEYGTTPQGVEGKERGQWVLVDFGDIVVHIFEQSMRGFYDLDGLWQDAPRIEGPEGASVEPDEPEYFTPA